MKNRIIKSIIFIVAMSFMSSCSDDFITETNPTASSNITYWKDLGATEKGLYAAYHTLHHPATLSIIPETLRSDLGWPGFGRPVPQAISPFYNQTFTNSTREIIDKWEVTYQGIFRTNQVIEALNNLDESFLQQEEWTSQMAQARFLRGMYHYFLYSTYNNGSIIIKDAVPKNTDELYKGLSEAAEVLSFIREDLEYAYANLYAKGEYPGSYNLGKATSGAAATLLGNTYLQEKDYTKAMVYYSDVINNHDYQLEEDVDLLFTTAGEHNSGSILEITYNNTLKPEANLWNGEAVSNILALFTGGVQGPYGPAWLTYEYANETIDIRSDRNKYEDETGTTLFRNVSLRASAMMAVVQDEQTLYYLDGTVTQNMRISKNGWGFAWFKKHTNHDIVADENDLPYGTNQSGKNVVVHRLAEVIINQAECLAETGDIPGALEMINRLRKRWALELLGPSNGDTEHFYDELTYDRDSFMEHLMYKEKPLELSMEGHAIRFLDLKRWGVVEENFAKLAAQSFYLRHYSYTPPGSNQSTWRWDSEVATSPPSNPAHTFSRIDYEYDIPSQNYNEELHGTYPIPLTEINSNPNISN